MVLFATTNKPVQQLAEPLQTRFMVFKFHGVQTTQAPPTHRWDTDAVGGIARSRWPS
jgi:hypothetical protein